MQENNSSKSSGTASERQIINKIARSEHSWDKHGSNGTMNAKPQRVLTQGAKVEAIQEFHHELEAESLMGSLPITTLKTDVQNSLSSSSASLDRFDKSSPAASNSKLPFFTRNKNYK